MKRTFGSAVLLLSGFAILSYAQIKCQANINGFKIRTVYIMGDQYNGVVWAYKHIAEETCLTPTTDLSKADAILEVHRTWTPGSQADTAPLTVSCLSNPSSTVCSDSTGNELTVNCADGVCTSYYGPSLFSTVSSAFNAWISTRWFESDARLYTLDHKILWKSEDQKGDWHGALWPDKVRLGTNSPSLQSWGIQSLQVQEFPTLGRRYVWCRVRSFGDRRSQIAESPDR
jgi:hypothetical protein